MDLLSRSQHHIEETKQIDAVYMHRPSSAHSVAYCAELVHNILSDFISREPMERWRCRWRVLARCALVCKFWSTHAMALLWHTIDIPDMLMKRCRMRLRSISGLKRRLSRLTMWVTLLQSLWFSKSQFASKPPLLPHFSHVEFERFRVHEPLVRSLPASVWISNGPFPSYRSCSPPKSPSISMYYSPPFGRFTYIWTVRGCYMSLDLFYI